MRPVLMTAMAMIVGMLPMSLGLGEGGEQNAPLGRAVIGGLFVATIYTLVFVPVLYSVLRRKPPVQDQPDDDVTAESPLESFVDSRSQYSRNDCLVGAAPTPRHLLGRNDDEQRHNQ